MAKNCDNPPPGEGGGAPTGAYALQPRHALRRYRRNALRARRAPRTDPVKNPDRPLRARSPLGAPPRLSSRGFRLHAIRSRPRVTRISGLGVTQPSSAPKPSTWHPDPSVEGVDTRTARERGYKPRPQEPLPPHQSAVTGDAPHGRDGSQCIWSETIVKEIYPKTETIA